MIRIKIFGILVGTILLLLINESCSTTKKVPISKYEYKGISKKGFISQYKAYFMTDCMKVNQNDTIWYDSFCLIAYTEIITLPHPEIDSLSRLIYADFLRMQRIVATDNGVDFLYGWPSRFCITSACLEVYNSKELDVLAKKAYKNYTDYVDRNSKRKKRK